MSERQANESSMETDLPPWLRPLDHTADLGIIVQAPDLGELFARSAWGMFALITDPPKVQWRQKYRLSIAADDRAALMVKWLSELNYRHVTQRLVFGRFHTLELNERQLVADVEGEPIDLERHTIYTEIKAVTFHELKITQLAAEWQAEIIFDV